MGQNENRTPSSTKFYGNTLKRFGDETREMSINASVYELRLRSN
jgi:hypothetical protein